MVSSILKLRKHRVLIDVDTQYDFFVSQGSHCIRNHRRVLKNLRRVLAWSRINKIKSVSTLQTYYDNGDHDYCIDGTDGHRKLGYSIRHSHILFDSDRSTDLPRNILREYDQIVLSKRNENPFDEPRAERILSELRADEFIVIGANGEGAVGVTVLGLLQRGKKVTVVTDAVGYQNRDAYDLMIRKMITKGANVVDTKNLAGMSKLANASVCSCKRCKGRLSKSKSKIDAA